MKRALLLFSFLLLFPALANAQLTVEDHLGMEGLKNPKVFGEQIVYVKTSRATWKGQNESSIYLTDTKGNSHQQLTQNGFDYDPQWSPDGLHVSFISYRDNLQQIYLIPKSGGTPKMISDAQAYISNYQWLDADRIAYVDDEPRDSLLVAKEQENGGGYVFGTEFYTNAVWTYHIPSGTRKKVTDGNFRIIEFDISADGKYLAIVGAQNYDTYEAIVNSWVEVLEIESGKSLYKFQEANSLNTPLFSPDGSQLSFVGSTEGYAANDGLFITNLASGQTKNLTYDFDPTIEHTQWIDNEHISFSTPRQGHVGLYSSDLKGKISTLAEPYWVIYNYQISEGKIYFTASRSAKTNQLYALTIGENPAKSAPLSNLNAALLPKIKTTSSLLDFKSNDGTAVQGIVNYPPGYDKDKTYPLMVIPHGGPDARVLDDFNWMGQFFADNGYVVFQPNFRGSIGYGRDFYAGNRNAFGVTDFQDIMAGVDRLIELKIADAHQLVMGGWSYGGYMANWAITQTDRFKAAISVAGVSNLVSLYGQHEFSNRNIGIWEYMARPIDRVENYRKASPIFFVKNATTPLLILHGAQDTRSPTLQAMEMYRAMKDAGKEVEMMLYPRAGHSIGNPVQFKSVLTNWLKWANKHVGK